MSEDTTITEEAAPEVAPETAVDTPSPTEESFNNLSEVPDSAEAPTDAPDFLDSLGDKFDAMASQRSSDPAGDVSAEAEQHTEADSPLSELEDTSASVDDFPAPEALSDTLDEKAVAKWGELRNELAEARSRAAELEAQVGEESPHSINTNLEEQLQEAHSAIESYEQQMAIARVEESSEYKRVVTEPLQAILDTAKVISDESEVDYNEIYNALSETYDRNRQNELLEGIASQLGERDKMTLYRMAEDTSEILARDAELREYAAEAAAELDQRNVEWEEEALQNHALETRTAVNKVFDKLESVVPDLEGVDLGDLRSKTLEDDFLSLGAEHQAYALSAGSVLPPMVKALRAKDVIISDLQNKLSSYQNASPGAAAAGGGVATPPDPTRSDDLGFLEAINSMAR